MAEVKKLKGILHAENLMVISKKKQMIGEAGDYYYQIGLTTGEDLLVFTGGQKLDIIEVFKKYNFGFDYIDKKLKIVDFVLVG